METHTVAIFKPFEFTPGQKIRIEGGPRGGDWLVLSATDKKVTLKCPVSGREFTWDRFCYFVEEKDNEVWPEKD